MPVSARPVKISGTPETITGTLGTPPELANRSWLAATHHANELDTLSKLTEGSDVEQEYLPNIR
jgi:hypothetical protein